MVFFSASSFTFVDQACSDERSDKIHSLSVETARKGEYNSAIQMLMQLTKRHPDNDLYLFDYMAVLGWAGQDAELLKLVSRLKGKDTPLYLSNAIAKAARNVKNFSLAITTYKKIIYQYPDRIDSRIALAMTLSDAGRYDEALTTLDKAEKQFLKRIDILEGRAYVLKNKEDYFSLLAVYQHILEIDPTHRDARREFILLTSRLGAPHLAADMVRKYPDVLTPEDLDDILAHRASITVRWGRLFTPDATDRYKETDEAIRLLKENLTRLKNQGRERESARNTAEFDLMVALQERERMPDAISIYESFVDRGVKIPPYALVVAADAYMYVEEPEKARDLSLQALSEEPDNFDASMTLFYAYTDLEDHENATTLIDKLAKMQPEQIIAKWPLKRKKNPQKLYADSTGAMARAYADNLEEAERRLQALVNNAPNNPDLRSKLGYVYLFRGWPRRALREFTVVLNEHPMHLDAKIGRVEALMALAEYGKSHEYLETLEKDYSGRKSIDRLHRNWEIHTMRELLVWTSKAFNSGEQEGSHDFDFETYLYSRPFNYHYRSFIHGYYLKASFEGGSPIYKRLGLGLEYRARDIELTGELSLGTGKDSNPGLSISSTWMPDDFWSLGFRLDTYDNDLPMRGRLEEDLHGWSTGLDLGYRVSESRSFSAGIKRSDFSDGNIRTALSASWFERLISRPKYKLDGTLGLYRSENSRDDAPYFNPESDLSAEITLDNEWLLYKRYSRSFRHRFGVSLGSYSQKGFGARGVWSARYEHQWNRDERLEFIYGISRSKPSYDGASEYSTRIYLHANWRF
ncbi:MAG: poly-beta-1,6 N-acetyl-D-glucosamine export porin PgaA [Proteobacteria bacterium]|nr:poly-beta-1,6 N-acetyl-D-glucosamine export porin PgaA [Pseudomonadota bacterium]